MSEKLKPCPFCGKTVTKICGCKGLEDCANYEECDSYGWVTVVCDIHEGGCGAASGYAPCEKDAIELWNNRVADSGKMGWISVSERLPEPEKNVLVFSTFAETAPFANISIGHLHQLADLRIKPFWCWIGYGQDMVHPHVEAYHRAEFICPGNEYITHWMPLPEPYNPKE